MSANLYEQDFHAWTQEQADLLKAGKLDHIDVTHLIEEMESMGATERREIISRLTVLVMHLLKWQIQLGRRGNSWRLTIAIQRGEVEDVLKQNPSLRGRLPEFFKDIYPRAVLKAAKETRLDVERFPEEPPFTVEQAIDNGYWPE